MRIVLPVLFALLLTTACGRKNQVPNGILPRDKMETVLWDMLQADEFVKEYLLLRDTTLRDTAESIKMYERVFQLNKTSREEFTRSFRYYQEHTSLLKEVLDSLNVRGQKESEDASRPKIAIDSAAMRKTGPTPAIDSGAMRKIRTTPVQ
jgi:hypothetical protein